MTKCFSTPWNRHNFSFIRLQLTDSDVTWSTLTNFWSCLEPEWIKFHIRSGTSKLILELETCRSSHFCFVAKRYSLWSGPALTPSWIKGQIIDAEQPVVPLEFLKCQEYLLIEPWLIPSFSTMGFEPDRLKVGTIWKMNVFDNIIMLMLLSLTFDWMSFTTLKLKQCPSRKKACRGLAS